MKYFLDTNAFWEVIKTWNSELSTELNSELTTCGKIEICMSEITKMEIHSVLGKFLRGKPKMETKCNRMVNSPSHPDGCSHNWISKEQKPLGKRETTAYIRLLGDILNNRNINFNIEIVPLDSNTVNTGIILLERYAYTLDFHSLDATIAASAIEKMKIEELMVVTYDKKLRNVLVLEQVNVR